MHTHALTQVRILNGIDGVPANIITSDIKCSNGVIHVIDHVLWWPEVIHAASAYEYSTL
jgi:uncharacterized surface protein with fasciclin (FAS1) repeats